MNGAPCWETGEELRERTLPPVDRVRLIKYAGASGDFNGIHLLDDAAEEAGFVSGQVLYVAGGPRD